MMNQRSLYHAIESFASSQFRSTKELLKHTVNEIVKSDKINIKGGRIWQYIPAKESYLLIHQIGVIEPIEGGYLLPLAKYPLFVQIGEHRSILANEIDKHLRKKGILKFYATGVGERVQFRSKQVYQYILAFNSDTIDQTMLPDLNIISLAVTALLRNRRIEQKAKLLEQDIDKAREIQESILPQPAYKYGKFEFYGRSVPARIVGGDFFDYLRLDDDVDRLSVVVCDAASKGFRAAAQALFVAGGLRMGISHHLKISALMNRLNRLIHQAFAEEQFVTLFYAEFLNVEKGLVLYANAGHNSPIVYHSKDKRIELLEPTGQILGPFPNEKYRVENVNLREGDVLVMYTDGITEATDSEVQFFGEKRLIQTVEKYSHLSSNEICDNILRDVEQYSTGSEIRDDRTIVVVKRIG